LALESARVIRDLRPEALFPAHSRALLNPAQALDEAIAYAAEAFSHRSTSAGPRQTA
jgi:hypothetical protein